MGSFMLVGRNDLLMNNEPSASQITLSWSDITVKVKTKRNKLNIFSYLVRNSYDKLYEECKILDNVYGKVDNGSLVALMGGSGSGKTTLLTVIGKRIEEGVEGDVYLNSQIVNRSTLVEMSGFVLQKDISILTLTAMEHMYFMSQMKLTQTITATQRKLWISKLLTELGLSGQEDSIISCLSGGERKRLSIAVELLHDPLILFCDEPTTGLDSYNAMLIIEKLKTLVKRGKIIVCSIHQPPSDVFSCFNQLIFLSCGKLAYHGPTDSVLPYFNSLGHPCPSNYNPGDFLVMKLAVVPGNEDTYMTSNEFFCQKFSESYLAESLKCNAVNESYQSQSGKIHNANDSAWCNKLYWLVWRNITDSMRTKVGHFQQLSVFLVTSFLLAIFYNTISTTTQQGIQDVHGLLYLISSEVYFTSAYRVLNTFPQEIPLFLKEKDLYPTSVYYISKVITMIPRTIIEPAIFLAIISISQYLGGNTGISYFTLLVPLLISACTASAYGKFILPQFLIIVHLGERLF